MSTVVSRLDAAIVGDGRRSSWRREEVDAFWRRYRITNIRAAGTRFRSERVTITARYGGRGGTDAPRPVAAVRTRLTARDPVTGAAVTFMASDVRAVVPVFSAWDPAAINNAGRPGALVNAYDWAAILDVVDLMRGVHGSVPVCWEAGMPTPPDWVEPNARLPFAESQRSDWCPER